MKALIIVFVLIVLWLLCGPAHSSPWTPHVEWVIEVAGGEYPFRAFQQGEYLKFEVKPNRRYIPDRIFAEERFIHEALDRRQPVATPEPATALLLASGLGILAWRKRR